MRRSPCEGARIGAKSKLYEMEREGREVQGGRVERSGVGREEERRRHSWRVSSARD
jgi:hypothetical protein